MTPLLEFRFGPPPRGHLLSELFLKEGVESRLIACRLTQGRPPRLIRWLEIESPPDRIEPLLRSLRRRYRRGHLAVARLGPGSALLRVSETAPSICAATYVAGGICVSCPLLPAGEAEPWRVILPRGNRANALLRELSIRNHASWAISRVEPYRSKTSLTHRQDRALRIAYDLGYFDYPRRAALGDVARALGSGRSATLEVLRRATSKLAGGRYGAEFRTRFPVATDRRDPGSAQ
ncbi:MAG: helix-turn-helix domain-containing protein [Thermoplasmata archaeon]|nr:helix-turn-helix domain-containing protein [Thermoplasmata archaeon]